MIYNEHINRFPVKSIHQVQRTGGLKLKGGGVIQFQTLAFFHQHEHPSTHIHVQSLKSLSDFCLCKKQFCRFDFQGVGDKLDRLLRL